MTIWTGRRKSWARWRAENQTTASPATGMMIRKMTYPLILAKIPVKNPWEIFAYLPFGNWNDCPNTPELMAAAKYWFEQYGAVPAAMSHDELEFLLPGSCPQGEGHGCGGGTIRFLS